MSQASDMIRGHHKELAASLERQVNAIAAGSADANAAGFVTFLNDELLPHARGEEKHLYPAVEPLVREHGTATATMSVDHDFITELIDEIDELTKALPATRQDEEEEAIDVPLVRKCIQLEAVLKLHLRKEEEVYLPLFEAHLSEDEQHGVVDGMHEG